MAVFASRQLLPRARRNCHTSQTRRNDQRRLFSNTGWYLRLRHHVRPIWPMRTRNRMVPRIPRIPVIFEYSVGIS